jgi:predicted esterase
MRALLACLATVAALVSSPLRGQTALPRPAIPPPPGPAGKIIESITCQGAPDQRYALYLPSAYRTDRAWPILYVMDPRSHGLQAAEALKAGAERYGWILASSYNTLSDQTIDPNVAALRAMWADTHARLAIDDRRVYLAGFSGTVRSAVNLALAAPGTVIGIFGAAAGFPTERPPSKDLPFDFFGTVGDRDFNYYEMMDLEKKLAALALPYRLEMFAGGHTWPPPELAFRGIGWLELRAMKRGLREKDAALVEELWAKDLEQARQAEAAGRIADAFHTWSAMKADYAGLRDVRDIAEAERKTTELGASAALQREVAAREARIKRDTAYLEETPRILSRAMRGDSETPPTGARVAAELEIAEWRQRAASTDVEESLAAKRVLNTLLIQTGYYLPRMLTGRKDYDNAILMISIAAEVMPDNAETWLELAAAHARKGKPGRKRALEALDKAVALGWPDRARVDSEPAFDALRQDERFREIVGRIPAKGAGG